MARTYPLEIILRHTGTAELVDADGATLWSSDEDADFRETVTDEFVKEEDIDELLDYLSDTQKISDKEAKRFETGEWDVTEESMDGDSENHAGDGEDEDDDDEDDEELEADDTEDFT